MSVFINRSLNLKKIKAIGFDMDYTIVRYFAEHFEQFTFRQLILRLISAKSYPEQISRLIFNPALSIQGLVIDKKRGNVLKLNKFGKVKLAYHGEKVIPFRDVGEVYKNIIDLNDHYIQSLDTCFSLSNGVLYQQLVELKKSVNGIPDFSTLADDLKETLDAIHRDGTLKNEVRNNIAHYIVRDEKIVETIEQLKKSGKKILLITNSDYQYTELLLNYTFKPFLKNHKDWRDVFEYVITQGHKPKFFNDKNPFLKINTENGQLSNCDGTLPPGIYQNGNAGELQAALQLQGEEILYLGDHIYGDVVSLKKNFNWRTGLVLEPLLQEIKSIKLAQETQRSIDLHMEQKEIYELDPALNDVSRDKVAQINLKLSEEIQHYQKYFNPYWGELMRAGMEESRFMGQVEKYACIYMAKVSDLLSYSPRYYFRPKRRSLPHEID